MYVLIILLRYVYMCAKVQGPWTGHGIVINGSNPSPYVMDNGTVVVAFKAIPNGLRVAIAPHWSGPYTVLAREVHAQYTIRQTHKPDTIDIHHVHAQYTIHHI